MSDAVLEAVADAVEATVVAVERVEAMTVSVVVSAFETLNAWVVVTAFVDVTRFDVDAVDVDAVLVVALTESVDVACVVEVCA